MGHPGCFGEAGENNDNSNSKDELLRFWLRQNDDNGKYDCDSNRSGNSNGEMRGFWLRQNDDGGVVVRGVAG